MNALNWNSSMSLWIQHVPHPSLWNPRERKATLERHPLSQKKKKLFTSASTLLLRLNRTKQTLRWNHQANELQLPPSLKPVKVLSQINDTDLELNAIGYTFSKIFWPEM